MKTTSEMRTANVRRLSEHYDGQQAFARQIDRSIQYVNQVVGSQGKSIGDMFARHIELKCHMKIGWLDHDHATTVDPILKSDIQLIWKDRKTRASKNKYVVGYIGEYQGFLIREVDCVIEVRVRLMGEERKIVCVSIEDAMAECESIFQVWLTKLTTE